MSTEAQVPGVDGKSLSELLLNRIAATPIDRPSRAAARPAGRR